MKIHPFKAIALLGLLLSVFYSQELKAQLVNPYPFKNDLSCPVKIQYEVINRVSGDCIHICDNGVSTVAPGATLMIPILPLVCVNPCGIRITVLEIDGSALSPPKTAGLPTPGPTISGPIPGSCGGGLFTLEVHYSGGKIRK